MTCTVPHWLDGPRFTGASDRWADVIEPATGAVSGPVPLASAQNAEDVAAAAPRAFSPRAATPLAGRTQMLIAHPRRLNSRKHELAHEALGGSRGSSEGIRESA